VINNKVNLGHGQYQDVLQNEIQVPSIPLGPNKYSDTGYRYKKNTINASLKWYSLQTMDHTFYEFEAYNTDTFDLEPSSTFNKIATMTFRLDTMEIEHERMEYSIPDFLGDIGGIADLLI